MSAIYFNITATSLLVAMCTGHVLKSSYTNFCAGADPNNETATMHKLSCVWCACILEVTCKVE